MAKADKTFDHERTPIGIWMKAEPSFPRVRMAAHETCISEKHEMMINKVGAWYIWWLLLQNEYCSIRSPSETGRLSAVNVFQQKQDHDSLDYYK